jgi:hypothetical protein
MKAVGAPVVIPLVWIASRERKWKTTWPVLTAFVPVTLFHLWFRVAGMGSLAGVYPRYWRVSPAPPWMNLYEAASHAITGGGYLALWYLLSLALIMTLALVKRVRPEYNGFALRRRAHVSHLAHRAALVGHPALRTDDFPGMHGTGPGAEIPHGNAGGSTSIFLLNWAILIPFFDWYPLI